MKLLLLLFFLTLSCKPPQQEVPKGVEHDRVNPGSNQDDTTQAPGANPPPAPSSTNQNTLDIPIEFPETLSVPVCDRTPAVRDVLITEATPMWRYVFWTNLSCEELKAENLKDIESLDLSAESIPEIKAGDFSDLPALKELDLSGNDIAHIGPGWFAELTNLEELKLEYNKINHLDPQAFEGLNNLKILNLESNKIEILPETLITHMILLEDINLSDNAIRNLPPAFFSNFRYLKTVSLRNNLFEGPIDCGSRPANSVDRYCYY